MHLYDNTRISEYKRCPRKFYFRHIMHWRPKGTKAALAFGSGWHSAMEVVWAGIRTEPREALARAAYEAFLQTWCEDGMPHPDEMDYEMQQDLSPRTPGVAYEMIVAYIDHRKPMADDFTLLAIERPFIVPLTADNSSLFYVGKIDKIVRYRDQKILGIEHKTTTMYKKNGPFRDSFTESFSPNSQVDGYLYALHMMNPGNVRGVWVDGALVHKSEEGFKFIPVEKRIEAINSWLWETMEWIRHIEEQKAALYEVTDRDQYMAAFPKNTNSCHDFNTSCEYIDLCRAWPNPVGRPMPLDFIEEVWDPMKEVRGLEELLGSANNG